jgi:hypothetical protein
MIKYKNGYKTAHIVRILVLKKYERVETEGMCP